MLNERQLVWRCRRGVRELDVLLTQFLASDYKRLNALERADFERLLDIQDPVIMDWLFGKYSANDEGLDKLVARLRELSGL